MPWPHDTKIIRRSRTINRGDDAIMRLRSLGILLVSLICITISGCSQLINTKPANKLFSQSISLSIYQLALSDYVTHALHQHPNYVRVVYSKNYFNGYLSQFVFSLNGQRYEGDDFAKHVNSKWSIINITYTPIDKSVPFTRMELGGTTKGGNPYMIISGVINNPRISFIDLNYIDGLLVRVMKLTNSNNYATYAYARTDSEIGVKSIIGYSTDGKKLYEYN